MPNKTLNWMDIITSTLKTQPGTYIRISDKAAGILVHTKITAITIADLLRSLYLTQGIRTQVEIGRQNPDSKNEAGRYKGWWYVKVNTIGGPEKP